MGSNREEPGRRLLGIPMDPHSRAGIPGNPARRARQGEEEQRVLGVPVSWYESVDLGWLQSLRHPVRGCRRWALRRRLGPYAPDESEPEDEG